MFDIKLSRGAALEVYGLVDAQIKTAERELEEARTSGCSLELLIAQDTLDNLLEARAALACVEADYRLFCED